MKGKKSTIVRYTLLLLLAAFLVYLAFRKVDWKAFMSGLADTRWAYVVLFCIASVAALVFRTARWKMLLNPVCEDIPVIDVWDATNIGSLANAVIPGAGEIVRCGYVTGGRFGADKSLGTILMERAWDVVSIVLLMVLALLLGGGRFLDFFRDYVLSGLSGSRLLWILAVVAVAAAVFFIWLVFRFRERFSFARKAADLFKGLGSGIASVFHMKRSYLFIIYTALVWLSYVLMSWFGLKAVPALSSLSFADAIFLSAIGNFASVIPVPGGIGAFHYLIALSVSSLYGASWDTGILYATLCHEMHAVLLVVLGAVSYVTLSFRRNRNVTHHP